MEFEGGGEWNRVGAALISGSAVLSGNGLPYWVSPLWPELHVFPSM